MNIMETGGRSARGKEMAMSRSRRPQAVSLYGDGSVMRRMQELVDTLAWVRIELAAAALAQPAPVGASRQERALAKMDAALDLAKQLVFELDAELRAARDDGTPPSV
jgi:hypothetical protein